jgi:hypothetical protein
MNIITQANSSRFMTIINTKSFSTNIQYNELNSAVILRIVYVFMFALGFLFRKSFIVGIYHKKVIIHHILYKEVSANKKYLSILISFYF